TAGRLTNSFFFAERQTAISRLFEHEPQRAGPNDVHISVRSNGRHSAFDSVITVAAITGALRDAHRHRERLATVGRAREVDVRMTIGIAAAVNIKARPGEIHVSFMLRLRRVINNDTRLIFEGKHSVHMIYGGD